MPDSVITSLRDALPIDSSYAIAFLLVVFYAGSRFKTPKTVRSQTSRVQFWLSAVAYVASCVGVFMLLTWGMRQNAGLVHVLHFGDTGHSDSDVANLDAALVAALMLTTLLPTFPMLRDIDSAILRFFHKMGSIPFCAQLWARQMEGQFAFSPDAVATMRDYILNAPHLPDTMIRELRTDPKTDQMRFRFTRNLAIYVALSNLKSRPRFADDYPEDVALFEKRMGTYFAQCVSFLALTTKLSAQELEEVSESVQKFRTLNLEAYEELRLMLARVLLYGCSGENEIIERLNRIGFALERAARIAVPLNLLSFDMIGVVVLFVSGTLVWSSLFSHGEMRLGKAIAIGVLVSVNNCIAAAFALLPKQVWSFADVRCTRERPYLSYILSAIIALTVSVPVSYAFFLYRTRFMPDSFPVLPFASQCKWLLSSTTLAFALAYACDDRFEAGDEPRWLRWAEGAFIAMLMGIAGLLIVQWLAVDRAALHPGVETPRLWIPILLNAGIGALFGATIPHWYRCTARRMKTPQNTPEFEKPTIGEPQSAAA
jgi:hypothetical protein